MQMMFKKFMLAVAVAVSVFGGWLTASPAQLYAEPAAASAIVSLEGEAKQAYITAAMDRYYHPPQGTRRPPFIVPDGYNYDRQGEINGVHVELLSPQEKKTDRVILHLHGGGYVVPLGSSHRSIGAQESQLLGGAPVYFVDYRLAPQHVYPAALDDAAAVYKGLLKQNKAKNIIVIGDSAGGNLALALALQLRDNNLPQPGALILISPWATLEDNLPSRIYNYDRDRVLGAGTPLAKAVREPAYAGTQDLREPYLSPLYADLQGLPPMLIQAGGYEVFLDECVKLARRAKQAGVPVVQTTYAGMPHDFAMLLPEMQESQASLREMQQFVDKYVK